MAKAAPSSKLNALHEALADLMLHELEFYRREDIPMPAADKAAIAKFLKDNSITCDPADAGDLERLREEFQRGSEERKTRLRESLERTSADVVQLYGNGPV